MSPVCEGKNLDTFIEHQFATAVIDRMSATILASVLVDGGWSECKCIDVSVFMVVAVDRKQSTRCRPTSNGHCSARHRQISRDQLVRHGLSRKIVLSSIPRHTRNSYPAVQLASG